ncbi:MAG: DNA (cytosine-5-)-methyltransferase [Planctomycetota bacterium]
MPTNLLIRAVPDHLRDWVNRERQRSAQSQQEFLLQMLESASRESRGPTLFDNLEGSRSSTPSAPAPIAASHLPFTFIDLFAGIGGMHLGLEAVGGRCLFACEWNRYAQKTYHAWFGQMPAGDINTLDPATDIPDHDILAAGFPCQPFSLAGVSKKNSLGREHGFRDAAQGTLFFRLAQIIDAKRPPVLLLENVKNLKSHDKGQTWRVIHSALRELGYHVFDKVIDAAGRVPQHRERVIIVGFREDVFGPDAAALPFVFPGPPAGPTPKVADILEPHAKVDAKYTLSDKLWKYLQDYADKHRAKGNGFGFGIADPQGVARTLSARYFKDGSEILIGQGGQGSKGASKNPRRLTPRECARLMGFPDQLPIVVSDTQAYKQFGNAVVPAVISAVGQSISAVLAWQLMRRGRLIAG